MTIALIDQNIELKKFHFHTATHIPGQPPRYMGNHWLTTGFWLYQTESGLTQVHGCRFLLETPEILWVS